MINYSTHYLCQQGYVLPGVCLSVCQQLHIKTTNRIFVNNLPIHPDLYPNLGFLPLWDRKGDSVYIADKFL